MFITVIARLVVVVVCGSRRCYTEHCHDGMSLRHTKNAHNAYMLFTICFSVRLCLYWHGGRMWWV